MSADVSETMPGFLPFERQIHRREESVQASQELSVYGEQSPPGPRSGFLRGARDATAAVNPGSSNHRDGDLIIRLSEDSVLHWSDPGILYMAYCKRELER
jgi:hypothetical protein